ncbi:hypothetical protein SDC9_113521 [bioreactor metagenome]|uniref:Uncharacterized protein n=1 Tax=bioreactor metagenome TaxID=1076179 RepID=A0A645BPV1_9ZZZZ
MIDGLAQIVEQARPLRQDDIRPDLRGQQAGHMGHLDGVVQNILPVAGTVFLPPQELNELGMQAVHVGLEHCPLALRLDGGVHLALGLFHHFLDAGGVNAAVDDELFQRQPGNFPAHRVETGDRDGLGGVVNDEIYAGHGFQGANVAAFAANNAALHLVIGQGNHRDGCFGDMVGGAALNGQGNDFSGAGVGLFLKPVLNFLNLHGRFVGYLGLQLGNEIGLGLLGRKARDPFQQLQLAALYGIHLNAGFLQLGEPVGQVFFLLFDGFQLPVQVFFLLLEPALLLGQVGAAFPDFTLVFVAGLKDFFLCFYQRFPLFAFGALDGFVDDSLGFLLGTGDLFFRDPLPILDSQRKPYEKPD